jgi:hypothetical protein
VCIRERGGWGRGVCRHRSDISVVIHTNIRQSHGVRHTVPVWVASTDAPVCMRERGGWDGECTVSEATSLLSYTLRYVSLAELGTLSVWVASTDAPIIRNCKDSHLSWKKNLPSVFEHLGLHLVPHIHMLTPGLPVFCSAAPTWFP